MCYSVRGVVVKVSNVQVYPLTPAWLRRCIERPSSFSSFTERFQR
jgi:hypothetical protein